MHISNRRVFIRSAARDFRQTGAVAPSSRSLAKSMTSEIKRRGRKGLRVLEVGGGTGSITAVIVQHLSRGDHLDVYEIDRNFSRLLRRRIKEDEVFRRSEAKIRIHNKSIELLDRHNKYDFIISCLPFTNFRPEMVRKILEIYREVLRPGGSCSFYEYLFLRHAARMMHRRRVERERLAGVARVINDYVASYAYGKDVVFRNLPPAQVLHMRF